MEFPEIAKLIVGLTLAIITVFTLLVYKFKFLKKIEVYTYLLTIINFISIFVYLSLDTTLFVAENEGMTYFILLIVTFVLHLIGGFIQFLVMKNAKKDKTTITELENKN